MIVVRIITYHRVFEIDNVYYEYIDIRFPSWLFGGVIYRYNIAGDNKWYECTLLIADGIVRITYLSDGGIW
jgi:hypothetical protein